MDMLTECLKVTKLASLWGPNLYSNASEVCLCWGDKAYSVLRELRIRTEKCLFQKIPLLSLVKLLLLGMFYWNVNFSLITIIMKSKITVSKTILA